jgi:hypothetical protein
VDRQQEASLLSSQMRRNPARQAFSGAERIIHHVLWLYPERIFGYRQATITTWLSRAGEHAQSLHERFFRTLHLPYLQLDELRTSSLSERTEKRSRLLHRQLVRSSQHRGKRLNGTGSPTGNGR